MAGGQRFNALWGFGPQNLLGVGSNGLLATWDGLTWSAQSRFSGANTRAIAAVDPDDYWLVGDRGVWRVASGADQNLLTTLPYSVFQAAVAFDGGEALGFGLQGSWAAASGDGGVRTTWQAAVTGPLNDVFVLGNAVVAAGGAGQSWLERFTNAGLATWSRRFCGNYNQTLQSVWISPSGYAFGTGTNNTTLGVRIDGSVCDPGFDSVFYPGVWGFSPPTLPLVFYAGDRFVSLMMDGGQPPNVTDLKNPAGPTTSQWNAVWGSSPQEVFVAGTDGSVAQLVGDYDAGFVPAARSSVSAELFALHGTGAGSTLDVWAVGQQGTVLRRQGGGSFDPLDAGISATLTDVWAGSPSHVWLVGADGGAWKYDGRSFSYLPAPVRELRRIYGALDAGVWAVGGAGAVLFHP
jgi:hypothetical protein